MLLSELLERLEAIAPASLAEAWDNVGLMLGDPAQEIDSILVALDPSLAAIEAAAAKRINLILTHHPLFFEPINSIDFSTPQGLKLKTLILTQFIEITFNNLQSSNYIILNTGIIGNDLEHVHGLF